MGAFRRTTFVTLALAVIAAGALIPAGPAGADEHHLAAFFIDYTPRSVDTNEGDSLTFANTDPFSGQGHTVTHHAAPGEPVLFDTEVVPFGSSVRVPNVENLKPGDYLIRCEVHSNMRAFLSVGGPPRPITDAIEDFLS